MNHISSTEKHSLASDSGIAIQLEVLEEPSRRLVFQGNPVRLGATNGLAQVSERLCGELIIERITLTEFAVRYNRNSLGSCQLIVEPGERFTIDDVPLRCCCLNDQRASPCPDPTEPTIALYSHKTGKLTLHRKTFATLEFRKRDGEQEVVALQDETLIIGNDEHCHLCVEDPLSSAFHASIKRLDEQTYLLYDLGSENGTFVNSGLITQSHLLPNDSIIIGDTELRFRVADLQAENASGESILSNSEQYEVFRVPQVLRHEMYNYLRALEANCEHLALKSERIPTEVQRIGEVKQRMESVLGMFRAVTSLQINQPGDIDQEILEILGINEYLLQKQGITPALKLNVRRTVCFDKMAMDQVLTNLIINAIQAMAQGGVLTVTSSLESLEVRISVQDSGPGIRSDILPNLFKPLISTKKNGSGLGLYISSYILKQHEGSLEAANIPEGGARFIVRWPGGRM